MAQHRDRERGVVGLVRARHARQRQGEAASCIAIGDQAVGDGRIPCRAAREQRRADAGGDGGDRVGHHGAIGLGDERRAGLGDARFLPRDACMRVGGGRVLGDEEELLVVDSQSGDAARGGRGEHVGCIEPSAEPDLDDAGIGGGARKGEEGGGGRRLEKARRDILAAVEHLGEQRRERGVGDQAAGNADPLVETHEMRAGIGVDALAVGFEHRAQEGDGRALAVGPRDMEHRRQREVRIAEPPEQRGDARQAEHVAPRRKHFQSVELRLDGGIGRTRGIGHAQEAVTPPRAGG